MIIIMIIKEIKKKNIFNKLITNDDINISRIKFFDYIQNIYLTNIKN